MDWHKKRLQRPGLTAYITHSDCLRHNVGAGHPECPERLLAIRDQLAATQVLDGLQEIQAPEIQQDQLEWVHPSYYLKYLEDASPTIGTFRVDPDTAISPGTLQAARRAAGAVIKAVDMVMKGEAPNAFCAIRPPGHHAQSDKAMGFCFYNNIAIGIAYALYHYHLKRVAIIDFDVHHGNGTEEIWQHDPRVLMVSIFQHPFFPYCGDTPLSENMLNIPVKVGTKGSKFREIVSQQWLPRLHDFKPEIFFISAGFDAHRDDDMGSLGLLEADYEWVTRQIMAIAEQYADGRIVSCLEGGYDLGALGRSATAHIKVLSDG